MTGKWTRLLLVGIAIFCLSLSACGGGGSDDDGDDGGPSITTGQFKNTYVEGLKYKCISNFIDGTNSWDLENPSKVDHTDKDGTYSCPSHGFVEFYIGNFQLGWSYELKSLITPYDLESLSLPSDLPELKVQLISQILQSIDDDQNLSNGIKISPDFDYLDDFDLLLNQSINYNYEEVIEQAISRGGYTLIDGATALDNLENSLNIDWTSYIADGVILYSVFKENDVFKYIKFELKNDGVAIATYESETQTGNYETLDEKILFIGNFSRFPPSYYKLQADDGNRLNVCLVEENTQEEWLYCEREYLYYNLDDVTNDINSGRLQ